MIEKTPQGFVSRYAIPTPPEPVENAAAHAAVDGPTDREIFDAGFRHGVLAGDNHIHYHGEQADRIFERAIKALRKMAEAFPLPAEPVEQAGGKDAIAETLRDMRTYTGPKEYATVHHSRFKQWLDSLTAATAELQAERDAAVKELQHIAIHHIGTTYPVPANEPPLYIQNRQRMGEYEDRERELTAKVERLEVENQKLNTLAYELETNCDPSGNVRVIVTLRENTAALESQITDLQSQLAKIAKCANHEQASRCLLAGDSWKNIGCNMIDSIQAIINPPGSSPSPSRPSGEEVERKLLEWLSTAAIVRVSGVDCILGDSAANSIAAKVRRIVEGESK